MTCHLATLIVTRVKQVEVIKLLHDKMKELQKEFANTPAEKFMRRPMFRITVLFVDDFVVSDHVLIRVEYNSRNTCHRAYSVKCSADK